jgi:hypothetical protein
MTAAELATCRVPEDPASLVLNRGIHRGMHDVL